MNNPCENCGHSDATSLYHAPAFDIGAGVNTPWLTIGRCRHCNIVFTIGADEADITAAYSSDYYGSSSRKFSRIIEYLLTALSRHRARNILAEWRRGVTDTRIPAVLDIGCGRGLLLRSFRSLGVDALGLERDGFPVHESIADSVVTGSFSDPQLENRRFDIVILWHVLEHIHHPETLLDEIRDHMNENALLVIAVPNFDSWQQKLFGPWWFHLDLPRHRVHLEPHWLIPRLETLGYSTQRVNFLEPMQAAYGFLQSTFNAAAPSRCNECYRLLKSGRHDLRSASRLFMWMILAIPVFPFACIESILSAFARKGATFTVTARLDK